jgi:hypothetical protein
MPWRVNQDKQTALDATDQFVAIFAIAESVVLSNDSIRVSKGKRSVCEIETSHPVARTALILVSLKIHAPSVVQ